MALYELSDSQRHNLLSLARDNLNDRAPSVRLTLDEVNALNGTLYRPNRAPAAEEMNPLYAALLDRDEATTVNVPMTEAELDVLAKAVALLMFHPEPGEQEPLLDLLLRASAAKKVLEHREVW